MVTRLLQLNRTLLLSILAVFTCFFVVILNPDFSSAATKGLTLSPLRVEFDIAPGTSLDGVLSVENATSKTMTVDVDAEEFSVINQQYDYAFTEESNVAKWVTTNPSQLSLAAGETKKIKFTVGVPLSAEPGGRYISLFVSTDTGVLDSGVESRQRIASLLYITVTGDVTRAGHLVSLSSPWAIGGNSTWSTAIQNSGTTHFRSRYNVKVKSLIFNDVIASMTGDALILPGTIRSISDELPAPQLPGIYNIVYTIGLGDTPAITETRLILYMPPWAIIVTISVVTALIFGLRRKVLKKR